MQLCWQHQNLHSVANTQQPLAPIPPASVSGTAALLLLLLHTGPDRSIIKQSYDARERLQDPSLPNHLGFGNLNGDGFGIGWYAPDDLREGDPTPCMYKSITPAW